ncbi:MAG: carbohydrate kinase family protein [Candidatus Latescibacteria bacterium]|jgi:adenosine kinase|nr:carbohydrate kinase family protein [Candidatus Latescibacterota bacterium]
MRIAIIGIINHDTIAMANGQELQDLGGILYNTAVLANIVDEQTSLFPVTRIGEDCYDMMTNILASYPNVDLSGVVIAPEGTSRNTIRYDASMEKVERLTNRIGSIPFDQIEPFLNHDAFLINFIIGDDISRETMRKICARSQGIIYLDVHNLCLGIDEQGYRFHIAQDRWQEWMEWVDVVQMNEVEASLLADGDIETDQDFIAFGKMILGMGPSIYIATRGRLGSVTVYRDADEIKTFISAPEPVEEVVDTTGCGDAFAAGFLTDYLITRNPVSATRLASWTAGVNCTLAGLSEVERFRKR